MPAERCSAGWKLVLTPAARNATDSAAALVSRIGDYVLGTGLLVGMFAAILWDVVLDRDIGAATEDGGPELTEPT